ncbi:MAG: PepSY domain-containing protein [Verrucomicrobiota bacterium]
MKLKNQLSLLLTAGILVGMGGGCAMDKHLQARARISEAQAREIALARVPNGKIKEGELEEENGLLIWSFDIATPGTKDISEVHVDATTGKILAVDVESAEKEAEEHEKKKHGGKTDDDEKDEKN